MSPELKPCPFCGGEAKKRAFNSTLHCVVYYVECAVCRVRTMVELEEEQAIEAWNRRAEDV